MTYIEACINGARTPDQHAGLPVTPDELAAAAVAAVAAGAHCVHMHPKSADGKDCLEADVVGAAIIAVREVLPDVPLGVTTGFWALPDAAARHRTVEKWTVLPGFASLNWHEPGSPELGKLLLSKGLGVEIGWQHLDAAESWVASDLTESCLRVQIELQGQHDVSYADEMLTRVAAAGSSAPVLLHGLDESCWALLEHAGVRGVQTRIGMEDVLTLPDGSTAPDNGALVAAAVELLSR